MMDSHELARLQASEEKYRRMVQLANDAILSIDTETGRVLGGNPVASHMTGYSLAELRTQHVWSLHPKEEQEEARRLFEHVRADGQGSYDGLHFERPDGTRVAVDVRANVIEYAGRRVIQRICRDITERRARERALDRHRALEDLVLNISTRFINLPSGIAGYRTIYEALEAIGAFSEMHRSYVYVLQTDAPAEFGDALSLSTADVKRGLANLFVWGADGVPAYGTERLVRLDGFEWALERLEADETLCYSRAEIYPSDGIEPTPFLIEMSKRYPCEGAGPGEIAVLRHTISVPVRSDGQLLGFLGFDKLGEASEWSDEVLRLLRMVGNILGNALARLAAQDALMRANDALEAKVQQRTRELQQKQAQLVQSEKMASLGQLVAGVAHEINTPLGALTSSSRTLRRTLERIETHPAIAGPESDPPADVQRWARSAGDLADNMIEAANRIDQVVTSLRRFARLDRSSVAALDMREALEDALTLVKAQMAEDVRIHRSFDDVEPVTCRAADVHQLLLNVLLNAVQATPATGQIWVRLRDETGGVRIEVEDDGPGIAPDVMPKIFDPGFTTKGVGVGAGLGLAIAHQVAHDHGGWIRVSSPSGALFKIWLPRTSDQPAPKIPGSMENAHVG